MHTARRLIGVVYLLVGVSLVVFPQFVRDPLANNVFTAFVDELDNAETHNAISIHPDGFSSYLENEGREERTDELIAEDRGWWESMITTNALERSRLDEYIGRLVLLVAVGCFIGACGTLTGASRKPKTVD